MAHNILTNVDFHLNEIQNALLQRLASSPTGYSGRFYFDTTDHYFKYYNGSDWVSVGAPYSLPAATASTLGGVLAGVANSGIDVDANGKISVDISELTGSIADGNTLFVTGDMVYDALALKLNLAGGTMSGAIAMGSNKITGLGAPSDNADAATKKYVDDAVAGASSQAMIFKGVVNSASDLPATHTVGWVYKVGTAGTYVGEVCQVGDTIICTTSGTVASDSDWYVLQTNIDGAVIGPASSTNGNFAVFDGTSGKLLKNGPGLDASPTASSDNPVKSGGVYTALSGKQDTLIFDDNPTLNSSNPVKSGGVYSAINGLIKTASGTITTSDTAVTVSYSGTFLGAYATITESNVTSIVLLDVTVGSSSVTFTCAQEPTVAVVCTVVYK